MTKEEFVAYLADVQVRAGDMQSRDFNIGDTAQLFDELTKDMSSMELVECVNYIYCESAGKGWDYFRLMVGKNTALERRITSAVEVVERMCINTSFAGGWQRAMRTAVRQAKARHPGPQVLTSESAGIEPPFINTFGRRRMIGQPVEASGYENPCAEIPLGKHDHGACAVPSPSTLEKVEKTLHEAEGESVIVYATDGYKPEKEEKPKLFLDELNDSKLTFTRK